MTRASCSSCTLYLARLCYRRSFWFPLLREPLVAGMRLLGRLHGIDHSPTEGPNPDCRGCLRHLKNRLKEVSPLFVLLNGLMNPLFNALRDSLVHALGQSGRRSHPNRSAFSGNPVAVLRQSGQS